jgi:flavodoxin
MVASQRGRSMNAIVLYDSNDGRTHDLATVIGEVLTKRYEVRLVQANDWATIDERPDLLVVGSPTVRRRPTQAILTALRKLPDDVLNRVASAAFCTRQNRPRFLTGAASLGIARRLTYRGARVEIAAESFRVSGIDGPLSDGERDRARQWANQVMYLVGPNPPRR